MTGSENVEKICVHVHSFYRKPLYGKPTPFVEKLALKLFRRQPNFLRNFLSIFSVFLTYFRQNLLSYWFNMGTLKFLKKKSVCLNHETLAISSFLPPCWPVKKLGWKYLIRRWIILKIVVRESIFLHRYSEVYGAHRWEGWTYKRDGSALLQQLHI